MFRTPATLLTDPEPGMWIMGAPLVWRDPVFGVLEVPVGFRTDLASIPRLFRNIPGLDPNGVSRRPAIIHDWLYAERSKGKPFADSFLRAALRAEGASPASVFAIYHAVHWFGGFAWRSDAGALEKIDFDSVAHYEAWRYS